MHEKQIAEEGQIRRLEEEARLKEEERIRKIEEEAATKAAARLRKKEKERAKIERQRKKGTYLAKAPKEAQAKAALLKQHMLDASIIVEGLENPAAEGSGKQQKVVYDNKKKKKKQPRPLLERLPRKRRTHPLIRASRSNKNLLLKRTRMSRTIQTTIQIARTLTRTRTLTRRPQLPRLNASANNRLKNAGKPVLLQLWLLDPRTIFALIFAVFWDTSIQERPSRWTRFVKPMFRKAKLEVLHSRSVPPTSHWRLSSKRQLF